MPDTNTDETDRIVTFLRGIGIMVEAAALPDDGFLPAIAVRDGVLLYDADRLQWPGDLLHEAGHIAVTDPSIRPAVSEFASDGGDEMAAIAWSYAAARAAGIDSATLFHAHGYKGEGAWLAELFDGGGDIGVPMLQYYGLAARRGDKDPPYPAMKQWLR